MDYIIDISFMKRDQINSFKEFDAEYYAKSLRNLKVLVASMLDDSERFMSVYQHCNSLCLDKSNTETDSENEAVKGMPSYLSKNNQKIEEHQNIIDEFLEAYYKERHTPKDVKMIKGAFTSQKLRNNELDRFNLSQGVSKDEEYSREYHAYRPESDEEESIHLPRIGT